MAGIIVSQFSCYVKTVPKQSKSIFPPGSKVAFGTSPILKRIACLRASMRSSFLDNTSHIDDQEIACEENPAAPGRCRGGKILDIRFGRHYRWRGSTQRLEKILWMRGDRV